MSNLGKLAKRALGATRQYSGERYYWKSTTKNKTKAAQLAQQYRDSGMKARISHSQYGWTTWVRS